MRFSLISSLLASSLVSLTLLDGVFASKFHVVHAGLKAHAGRAEAARRSGENHLAKRFSNARFSFFDTGLGACGQVNRASDFVVALNHAQFDSDNYCFQTITISYGGKTAQAQVVDRCVECPYGALDFTRGLFDYFGRESQGYLYGVWSFGAGEPTPKPTPTPPPTITWKIATSIAIYTSSTPSTTSTTNITSTSSASTSSSAAAVPTPNGILADANQILLNFAGIAIGASADDA